MGGGAELVNEIRSLREISADPAKVGGEGNGGTAAANTSSPDQMRTQIREKFDALEGRDPEKRMIYAHVDEQAVASVVSDWTGIPVGRMVKDEVETILSLADILNRRVVGQSHGLQMIAKRIETNRAKLDNPNKPIGVFMLVRPIRRRQDRDRARARRGALRRRAEHDHDQHVGVPGGAHRLDAQGRASRLCRIRRRRRLTEAVRRRPYSVVLLDEVEKAHPDVHEIFFQVFDKGMMEDGKGRRIDFKNTLIILTSNVGTDMIMGLSRDPHYRENPQALAEQLRPELLKVFPAALLGRIVSIPYFPLSDEMLGGIVRLQLGRIAKRIEENHDAKLVYGDDVVGHIVSHVQRSGLRRPHDRQHHHQYDVAGALARIPQAVARQGGACGKHRSRSRTVTLPTRGRSELGCADACRDMNITC